MISRVQSIVRTFRRLCRRWRMLTLRKLLYLPRILSGTEKRLLLLFILMALASGTILATRSYVRLTYPVAQKGGSYTEGILGSLQTINPIYASQDPDRDLSRLVFSGLLYYDGAGHIQPDLAERWEISPNGKVYTVILRDGLVWHDGRQLSAEDVVFTISRIQNPQFKSPLRLNWQGVQVEVLDPRTIKFTLRTPYAPFIENLTQGIIPKHLWEAVEPARALLHELNLRPIGSGPYQVKTFKSESDGTLTSYTLVLNPRYHRESPYIKTITFKFFSTEEEMLSSKRRGDTDGFGPISSLRAKEFSQDDVQVLAPATPRIFSVFLNQRQSPILGDKKVRAAIARALDKDRIASETATGGAIAVSTLLPPLGAPGAGQTHPYSPERARAFLKEAGWKDENGDGIYEKKIKDKKKTELVPLELRLATGNSPELLRAAGLIKDMLAEIWVQIIIEPHSFDELESSVIRPRNFQLLLFGQVYGYEPDPFAFWHSSQIKDPGLNIAFFTNKQADRVLEEARRTTDPSKRAAKYAEFNRIAAEELPAIPLYTQLYLYLLPRDVQGVSLSKISVPADRLNEINRWYRETKRVLR